MFSPAPRLRPSTAPEVTAALTDEAARLVSESGGMVSTRLVWRTLRVDGNYRRGQITRGLKARGFEFLGPKNSHTRLIRRLPAA